MAHRARAALSACLFGLSACGGAPHEASSPIVAIDAAPPRASVPPTRGEPRPAPALAAAVDPIAPALAWPREVGCSLRAGDWKQLDLRLRLRPGGPPYAEASGEAENIKLVLPVGGAERGATVELDALGVRLRGILEADEVRLFPALPFVVGGVLVPGGDMPLRWTSTAAGSVTYELRGRHPLSFVGQASGLTRSCDEVNAERTFFEPSDAPAIKAMRASRPARLRRGVRIPLAEEAGGAPRAMIELGKGDPDGVSIAAVRGGSSRILWWAGGADESEGSLLVFGWVPSSSLRPGSDSGSVSGGKSGGVSGSLHWVGCPEDLPLWAEIGGERLLIGRALKGTRVQGAAGGATEGDLTAVEIVGPAHHALPKPVVRAAPGARLLMRPSDVERCGG
jgi:hypothetical protein